MSNYQELADELILRLQTWNSQPDPLDSNTGNRMMVESRSPANESIAALEILRNAVAESLNTQVQTLEEHGYERNNVRILCRTTTT